MSPHRGFTLLELLVGLVLAGVVAAALAGISRGWLAGSTQQREVAVAALELSQVYRATSTYLAEHTAALPDGLSILPLSTLIAQGLLPATFAQRHGAVGTSPWYQNYRIGVHKSADAPPRAVI